MSHTTSLCDYAIQVSDNLGLQVFPCRADKRPACANGHLDATDDPEQIERLFRGAPDATLIGAYMAGSELLAIDDDTAKKPSKAASAWIDRNLPTDQVRIHRTPSGGAHYIYDVTGLGDLPSSNGVLGAIDFKHRGYIIWPSPGSEYEVVEDTLPPPLPDWLLDEMRAAIAQTVRNAGGTGSGAMIYASSQEAIDALNKDPEGASRHDALMRLTHDAVVEAAGKASPAEITDAVIDLIEHLRDPLGLRAYGILDRREGSEVWRLVEGAMQRTGLIWFSPEERERIFVRKRELGARMFQPADGVDAPPPAPDPGALAYNPALDDVTKLPPYPWVYGHYMMRGRPTVTAAQGGVGKSTMTITDACALAAGKGVLGTKVWLGPTRTLYWAGEEKRIDPQKKVAACCAHHDIDVGDHLLLLTADDYPLQLVRNVQGEPVVQTKLVDGFIAFLRDNGVVAAFLDPMVTTHDLSENSNNEMAVYMQTLRNIAHHADVSLDVVHHAPKGSHDLQSLHSDGSDQTSRGASAINDGARAVRYLATMGATFAKKIGIGPKERHSYVGVTMGKANLSSDPGDRTWLQKRSHMLGNATPTYPDGDSIGVMEMWQPPAMLTEGIDKAEGYAAISRAANNNSEFETRRVSRYKGKREWFGYYVADELGLDVGDSDASLKLLRKSDSPDELQQGVNNDAVLDLLKHAVTDGILVRDVCRDRSKGRDLHYFRLPSEAQLEP